MNTTTRLALVTQLARSSRGSARRRV